MNDSVVGQKGEPAARQVLDRYKGERGLAGTPGEPGLQGIQGSPGKHTFHKSI